MNSDMFEATKERELILYKQEVESATDPKLHILIVHLYVEHLLERYLAVNLKTTKRLFGKNGLSFEKKLLIVEAMGGLTPQLIDSIRKLNALRNGCAHQFQYKPTDEDLEAFGWTLGKIYAEIKSKVGKDKDLCMRRVCRRLCGMLARAVVDAEQSKI